MNDGPAAGFNDKNETLARVVNKMEGDRVMQVDKRELEARVGDGSGDVDNDGFRIPLQDLEIISYQSLLVAHWLVVIEEQIRSISILGWFETIVAVLALPFCGGTRNLRCIGMRLGLQFGWRL